MAAPRGSRNPQSAFRPSAASRAARFLKKPDNVDRVNKNAKIISEESTTRLENMLKGVMDFLAPLGPGAEKSGDFNVTVEESVPHADRNCWLRENIHSSLDLGPLDSRSELRRKNQIMQVLHNLIRKRGPTACRHGGALSIKTGREGRVCSRWLFRTRATGIPKENSGTPL